MLYQTSANASIHPSIDGLVAMIAGHTKATPATESVRLRELCVRKIRSYREDVYLKRYTTPTDVAAAKDRWQVVTAFANGKASR